MNRQFCGGHRAAAGLKQDAPEEVPVRVVGVLVGIDDVAVERIEQVGNPGDDPRPVRT